MFRAWLIYALAAGVLTACGAGAANGPVIRSGQSQALGTSSASPGMGAATSAPMPTAAPTPTAPTPTPAPPSPLVAYRNGAGTIVAVDGTGQSHWAFREADLGLGPTPTVVAAGPNLIAYGAEKVKVVSSGGIVIGTGSYSVTDASPYAMLSPDPSGRRWAWTTDDEAPSTTTSTSGNVWVAGIGEAPHSVLHWSHASTPGGDSVEDWLFLWSDAGLVIGLVPVQCAPYPQEISSFLLDPATGRQTPLAGGDRHIVDVHAGTSLGIHIDDASKGVNSVLLGGAHVLQVSATLDASHIDRAAISPDGTRFFATLWAEEGCGGADRALTLVDAVTGGARIQLSDMYAFEWYDDSHLVVRDTCSQWAPGPGSVCAQPRSDALRVVDLTGAGPTVGHGWFIGVLRPGG